MVFQYARIPTQTCTGGKGHAPDAPGRGTDISRCSLRACARVRHETPDFHGKVFLALTGSLPHFTVPVRKPEDRAGSVRSFPDAGCTTGKRCRGSETRQAVSISGRGQEAGTRGNPMGPTAIPSNGPGPELSSSPLFRMTSQMAFSHGQEKSPVAILHKAFCCSAAVRPRFFSLKPPAGGQFTDPGQVGRMRSKTEPVR